MAGNRDVILADFQACTDIDDVGEAILHLEETNWDLIAAINNVMPKNTQQLPSELNRDVEMIEEIRPVPRIPEVVSASQTRNSFGTDKVEILPGTSNSRNIGKTLPGTSRLKESSRNLIFHIHYQSDKYKIELSDKDTVGDLKLLIYNHTNVAPCQQQLHGWRKEPKGDNTSLKSLELPRENELFMSPIMEIGDSSSQTMKLSERLASIYTLNIKDEEKKTTYKLNFPGTHTILDVKSNIYTLNDVPVRNQLWKGWPPIVKSDTVTLAESGIPISEHNLVVERIPTKETKKEVVDLVDTDSSVDEQEDGEDYEDAPETFQVDDDIFVDHVQPTKNQHLIPDNVDDEISGTVHFIEEYEKRYGSPHPNFFTGTFENALQESCYKPPRERKLLAVYLHHDNSILANVFCTQILGFETVLQLLSANFVVWGWDFTYESNKQKFLTSIQQTLGPAAAMTVRNVEVDTMPVLMVIMRTRYNTDFTMIHGNVSVNELLANLIEAVDVFQEQRQSDIESEDQRQARERVKEEQDQAYQESLAADRAKEEAKQLMEKIEKQRKEEAENERLAEQARKEAHRLAVESSLPPEPPQDLSEGVLKVKVRLPSGNFLERRFHNNATLQTLLNFLIVKGYPTEDYKVIANWPRRDLTVADTSCTLSELKFCPQETVILEER